MIGRKTKLNPENVDTLIGTDTILEGNIETQGSIRIDGKVKGDIKVAGDLFIGDKAVINGNIYANNAVLSGTLEGNIRTTGVLKLNSTARLYGDIEVRSFVTDEGAIFSGKCSMLESNDSDKSSGKDSLKKSAPPKDSKKGENTSEDKKANQK